MRYFPFLKWAGGKRWLSSYVQELLPETYAGYFEPFVGGAAMFGSVQPDSAVLSDLNEELINCYRQVSCSPDAIAEALSALQTRHSSDTYYKVRAEDPENPFDRAVRFLYLNRACFNGIYRVNQKGRFNVPKGTKNTIVFPYDDFPAAASLLRRAEITAGDFEAIVDRADAGDFIFCDPPYTVAHNNNGFVRYNEQMFSWQDQVRLCRALCRASDRGAYILLTNAAHASILELYAPSGFDCRAVGRRSVIGGGSEYRGEFAEYLISNYPLPLFGGGPTKAVSAEPLDEHP